MTVLPIPVEPTDESFVVGATPTTGPWAFQFNYFVKEDLRVTVNGVPLLQSQFAVSGGVTFEGGHDGGSLTLSAAVSSCTVRIYRQVEAERTDAFSPVPSINLRDLDISLNRLAAMIQDTRTNFSGSGGGGGGGAVYWVDVLGKPSTFAPAAHTHDWAEVTGKPAFGALATLSAVNDANWSGTDLALVNGGTGASTAANARANLGLAIGSNVQAYHDALQAIEVAGPASNGKVYEWTGATTGHFITTPGGGGSSTNPPPLTTFGTVDSGGVNTAANNTTFAAAEASAYDRIWVPEGLYATTRTRAQLTKGYTGPGTILVTTESGAVPGHFRALSAIPTIFATQGLAGWFRGDQHFGTPEYHVIGAGSRGSVTARYFESPYIPHNHWFDVNDGGSGALCHLTVAASTGSNVVTVDGVNTVDVVGKTVVFAAGQDGTPLDTRTVTAATTTTLTLSSNPSANHPIGTVVYTSKRTQATHTYVKMTVNAEGDAYTHTANINQAYVKKPGQKHFFETSTASLYGGAINFVAGSAGSYGTTVESQFTDNSEDVAAIAYVQSFTRNNDTGAMAAVWMGTYFKAEGSKPADVAHAVAGNWRVGLDTVKANLTNFAAPGDNANVAINMAKGHRIVFNSTASLAGRGGSTVWGTFYGNTLGDMFLESGNDGISDFMAMRFNRGAPNDARLRVRPTQIQANRTFACAEAILAGTDMAVGAAGVLTWNGTGHFLFHSGTNLYWWNGSSNVLVA